MIVLRESVHPQRLSVWSCGSSLFHRLHDLFYLHNLCEYVYIVPKDILHYIKIRVGHSHLLVGAII